MPRFYHGMGAIGAALPALQKGAFDQASLSYAIQEQKLKSAQRQMDFDNAVTISKIKESQVVRQLEQSRIDQQRQAQAIGWRNQIAALGGRALPDGEQPGANDIVQVDPFTGGRFAYMQPEYKAKMEEAREEVNAILRKGGRVLDAPQADSYPMQMPDGKTVHVVPSANDPEGWDKRVSRMVQFISTQQGALVAEAAKLDKPIMEAKKRLAQARKSFPSQVAAQEAALKTLEDENAGIQDRMKRLNEGGDFWSDKSGQPVEVPWKYTMQGIGGEPEPVMPGAPDANGVTAPVDTPRGKVYPGGITVTNMPDGQHEFSIEGRPYASIPPERATITRDILVKALEAPGARETIKPEQVQTMVALQVLTPVQLATLNLTEYGIYVKALRAMATGEGDMKIRAQDAYNRIVAQAMARTKAPAP